MVLLLPSVPGHLIRKVGAAGNDKGIPMQPGERACHARLNSIRRWRRKRNQICPVDIHSVTGIDCYTYAGKENNQVLICPYSIHGFSDLGKEIVHTQFLYISYKGLIISTTHIPDRQPELTAVETCELHICFACGYPSVLSKKGDHVN